MALTTSVISLLVLLLATYCYSVPIQPLVGSSTPDYAFTTGKTIVDHENHVNMQLLSDEESTGVPNIHKPRSDDEHDNDKLTTEFPTEHQNVARPSRTFMGQDSAERTTEFPTEHQKVVYPSRTFMGQDSAERTTEFPMEHQNVARPSRTFMGQDSAERTTEFPTEHQKVVHPSRTFMGQDSAERTTEFPIEHQNVVRPSRTFMGKDSAERTTEFPIRHHEDSSLPTATSESSSSSDETNDKRGLSDFLLTTMESSTDFEHRAIRNNGTEPEIVSVTRAVSENEVDTTTDIEPSFSSSTLSSETESESSSSVNSFGKATGLLRDNKLAESSTTVESEKHEQSVEESTTRFLPIQNHRLTKTVQIIPGKVVETKIYANAPSRTYVVPQRNQQIQLSQGEKQSIIEKEESNN